MNVTNPIANEHFAINRNGCANKYNTAPMIVCFLFVAIVHKNTDNTVKKKNITLKTKAYFHKSNIGILIPFR